MINEFARSVFTMTLAWCAGWLLHLVNAPAPYLLGSVFGVWLLGALQPRLQPFLGVAYWLHRINVLGLATLFGAAFTPALLDQARHWPVTFAGMIITTVLATITGFLYLSRRHGYAPRLALLCALPGGQAEIISIARDYVEKDYVVALCHLTRVTIVLLSTPILLAFVQGHDAVVASNQALFNMASLVDLESRQLFQFAALCIGGYAAGRFLRLPIPHLLGPMLVSGAAHLAGLVTIPRISEFVLLAQLGIGGMIGARLARVPWQQISGYLGEALIHSLLVIGVYLACSVVVVQFTDLPFLNLMLAFIPGGIYEVSLLAILFSLDVILVSFHHAVRVILIFFALPVLMRTLEKRDIKNPPD